MAVVATSPTRALAAPRVRGPRPAAVRVERLAALAAGAVALRLVASGVQRVAPGAWLDWGERALVGLAWLLVLATAAAVWARQRDRLGLLVAVSLAPVGLLAQATVETLVDSAVLVDVARLGLGLLTLGLLVWTATTAGVLRLRLQLELQAGRENTRRAASAQLRFFRRVAEITSGLVFLALVSGAAVRAVGASWACVGFPTCNDLGVLPLGRGGPLMDLHLYHRLLSLTAAALVGWLAIEAQRVRNQMLARAALGLAGLTLLEAIVGANAVLTGVPAAAELLHLGLGVAVWASAVRLLAVAAQPSLEVSVPRSVGLPSTLDAYVQLTKPRVMSLLLVTTAAAMVVAARGLPRLDLLVATLVGGALMSGGAGAINHYVDRDIDPLMGRTAWRPIPSGRVSPRRALVFGLVLSLLATCVLVAFVNPLAAALALVGLFGYVGVYSLWLKRSTPSNIVIGGAAGAVPPLVGWAAVTGDVGLTAWYLFAIVFFWTPPHFWALALLIKHHYARAQVPMLPVVRGEAETRWQILLYAVLVVALTLVLPPLGLMGLPYFVSALLLGGWFVWTAVRLWRDATPAAARHVYISSILYLFALFAAMAVDRSL
jgi:protoheme IX farnesyltransferase